MDIYLITCKITNKKYIGQTCHYMGTKKQKWGYLKRWEQHKSKTSRCTLLKNAIQKYGTKNFSIECLLKCDNKISDYYEKIFIDVYNTLYPNGYNLESGGNKQKKLSTMTKNKMSESRKGKSPFKMTQEISTKISKSLVSYNNLNPKIKLDHNGNILPKYISTIKQNEKIIGYTINNHKTGYRKKITSKYINLDEKLKQILNLLEK